MSAKPLKDNLRTRTAADLRDERDLLGGWIRQPEVRWLDPSILAKAGVEVAVSGTFGKFADKREIQTREQGPFDYSADGELWIDYLSDTGDGWAATQTMAWVLAQPSLTVGEHDLPRGKVLLLGGDQVYPSATPEAYEDRFKGPFAAALPHSLDGQEPDMYATPGNHDWYDGLVSFLRLFCAEGWIGGWRTRQRRSYFALKLPNRWWVWAIDIQLDTYIDDVQLAVLHRAGHRARRQDRPADRQAELGRGGRRARRAAVVALSELLRAADGARQRRAAGRDDHRRPPPLRALRARRRRGRRCRRRRGSRRAAAGPTCRRRTRSRRSCCSSRCRAGPAPTAPRISRRSPHRREQIYPRAEDSKRLSNGILKLAVLNPAFGRLLGALYVLVGVALLGRAEAIEQGGDDFLAFLSSAAGGMGPIVVAALLLGGIYVGVDIKPDARSRESRLGASIARLALALAQTAVHVLVAGCAIWLALRIASDDSSILPWLIGLPPAFIAGATIGTTVFAFFMLLVHKIRGTKAQNCSQPGLHRPVDRRLQEPAAHAAGLRRRTDDPSARRRARLHRVGARRPRCRARASSRGRAGSRPCTRSTGRWSSTRSATGWPQLRAQRVAAATSLRCAEASSM